MADRSGVLKNSPLFLAIASIRFAPWPSLGKRIDEIHEELREITPLIQRIHVQSQVPMAIQSLVAGGSPADAQTHWLLLKSNRKTGVLFTPEQLLLVSMDYLDFESFSTILGNVLSVLISKMRFIDVLNLGVRYVDNIKISTEESFEKYIFSGFLAPEIDSLDRIGGATFANYRTGDTELRVRCVAQPGLSSIPEDLLGMHFMLQDPSRILPPEVLGENEFILDMDAITSYSEPKKMGQEEVLQKVASLHKIANEFFRNPLVCTDHAFKIWKGD